MTFKNIIMKAIDSDNDDPSKEESVGQIFTRNVGSIFDVYINGPIIDSKKYINLFNLLRTTTQNDRINIYINSTGGYVDTGLQFLASVNNSQAYVNTIIDGSAQSIAAIMSLAGDEITVQPNCIFMLHNCSWGNSGKGHEMLSASVNINLHMKNLLLMYTSLILSKEEIDGVIRGDDIYLSDEELIGRLSKFSRTVHNGNSVVIDRQKHLDNFKDLKTGNVKKTKGKRK